MNKQNSVKFNFYAKNCTFDLSNVDLDSENILEFFKINLFSGNCDEAEEIFQDDFEEYSEKFNVKVVEVTKSGLTVDVDAEWSVPLELLQVNSADELAEIRDASDTWNDMVSVYLEVGDELVYTDTIEEVDLSIE